ncbi:hypothetical protein E0M25_24515 [Bacillus mycoides]|uniref:hypothetical protein n=1 Tax=Bacillus mycoides TaxID=1405 RepID=UPI001040797D|nr:hypothetical protein [Bacillus mycoides]TBX72053.1 hypothetical protein E0M25_24515 [Bacillus mycoides]
MEELATYYRVMTTDKEQAIEKFLTDNSGRFKNIIPSTTKSYKEDVGRCMVKDCNNTKALHFAHSHREGRRMIIKNIIVSNELMKEKVGGYEFHASMIFEKYRAYHNDPKCQYLHLILCKGHHQGKQGGYDSVTDKDSWLRENIDFSIKEGLDPKYKGSSDA